MPLPSSSSPPSSGHGYHGAAPLSSPGVPLSGQSGQPGQPGSRSPIITSPTPSLSRPRFGSLPRRLGRQTSTPALFARRTSIESQASAAHSMRSSLDVWPEDSAESLPHSPHDPALTSPAHSASSSATPRSWRSRLAHTVKGPAVKAAKAMKAAMGRATGSSSASSSPRIAPADLGFSDSEASFSLSISTLHGGTGHRSRTTTHDDLGTPTLYAMSAIPAPSPLMRPAASPPSFASSLVPPSAVLRSTSVADDDRDQAVPLDSPLLQPVVPPFAAPAADQGSTTPILAALDLSHDPAGINVTDGRLTPLPPGSPTSPTTPDALPPSHPVPIPSPKPRSSTTAPHAHPQRSRPPRRDHQRTHVHPTASNSPGPVRRHSVSSPEYQQVLHGIYGWSFESGRPNLPPVRSPRPAPIDHLSPPSMTSGSLVIPPPVPSKDGPTGIGNDRMPGANVDLWRHVEQTYKSRASGAPTGSGAGRGSSPQRKGPSSRGHARRNKRQPPLPTDANDSVPAVPPVPAIPGMTPAAVPMSPSMDAREDGQGSPGTQTAVKLGPTSSPAATTVPPSPTGVLVPMSPVIHSGAPSTVASSIASPSFPSSPMTDSFTPAATTDTSSLMPTAPRSTSLAPPASPTTRTRPVKRTGSKSDLVLDDVALLMKDQRRQLRRQQQQRRSESLAHHRKSMRIDPSLANTADEAVVATFAELALTSPDAAAAWAKILASPTDVGVTARAATAPPAAAAAAASPVGTPASEHAAESTVLGGDAQAAVAPGADDTMTLLSDSTTLLAGPTEPPMSAPSVPTGPVVPSEAILPEIDLPDVGFRVAELETTIDVFTWASLVGARGVEKAAAVDAFINGGTDDDGAPSTASPLELVRRLTEVLDYEYLEDFFVVYRMFMEPVHLARLLVLRMRAALPVPLDSPEKQLVRMRTGVVLRHWFKHYFETDFADNKKLRRYMSRALKMLTYMTQLKQQEMDARTIKALKHTWINCTDSYVKARSPATTPQSVLSALPPVSPGTLAHDALMSPQARTHGTALATPPHTPSHRATVRLSQWSTTSATSQFTSTSAEADHDTAGELTDSMSQHVAAGLGSTHNLSRSVSNASVDTARSRKSAGTSYSVSSSSAATSTMTASQGSAAAGLEAGVASVDDSIMAAYPLRTARLNPPRSSMSTSISLRDSAMAASIRNSAVSNLSSAESSQTEDEGDVDDGDLDDDGHAARARYEAWETPAVSHTEDAVDPDVTAEHITVLSLEDVAKGQVLLPPPQLSIDTRVAGSRESEAPVSAASTTAEDENDTVAPLPMVNNAHVLRSPSLAPSVSQQPHASLMSPQSPPLLTRRASRESMSTHRPSLRSRASSASLTTHMPRTQSIGGLSSASSSHGGSATHASKGAGSESGDLVRSAMGKIKSMFGGKGASDSSRPSSGADDDDMEVVLRPRPQEIVHAATSAVHAAGVEPSTTTTVVPRARRHDSAIVGDDVHVVSPSHAPAMMAPHAVVPDTASTAPFLSPALSSNPTLASTATVAPSTTTGVLSSVDYDDTHTLEDAVEEAAKKFGLSQAKDLPTHALPNRALMGKSPPWVMKVRSAEVAQHLSIVDEVILRHVDWTELLDIAVGRHPFATKGSSIFGGSSRNSRSCDPNDDEEKGDEERDTVKAAIDRFNTTCQWVQSQVLIVEDSTLRSKVIEKFIKIAAKCEAYRNYCTLMAIVVALQSINISRLSRTWARISSERKALLDRLIHLTSPTRNFIELRNAMESAPGVPFAGVYFSDLLFNNEIPSTVNIKSGTSSSATSETDEDTRASSSMTRSSHSGSSSAVTSATSTPRGRLAPRTSTDHANGEDADDADTEADPVVRRRLSRASEMRAQRAKYRSLVRSISAAKQLSTPRSSPDDSRLVLPKSGDATPVSISTEGTPTSSITGHVITSAAVASRAILDFEGDIVTVVNWQKYKVIAKVVRRFKAFLDSASYDAQFKWALRDDVFWHAVYIDRQVLDADELTRRSYAYEPSQRSGTHAGGSGATGAPSSSTIRSP